MLWKIVLFTSAKRKLTINSPLKIIQSKANETNNNRDILLTPEKWKNFISVEIVVNIMKKKIKETLFLLAQFGA